MGNVDWEGMRSDLLAFVSKGTTTPDGLRRFVDDPDQGLFGQPKITVRLPQRPADPSTRIPLQWMPSDFVPTRLQAEVISQLSVSGQLPRPSFIVASPGIDRSRAVWLPMLDHCARQVMKDRVGVKALVLYPTRAAAVEDAARVAELCRSVDGLTALRGGVLVDDAGTNRSMGPANLVDSLVSLGESPVDVLLTTPAILDRTLKDQRYHQVWRDTPPASLRYVVVDSVERYDEDQVVDLAVLLRRLGASLHMASRTQPLPGAVPVLTAAIDYADPGGNAPRSTPTGAGTSTGSSTGIPTPPAAVPPTSTGTSGSGLPGRVQGASPVGLPGLETPSGFGTRGTGGGSLFGKREESTAAELPDIGPLRGLGRFLFDEDFSEGSVVSERPVTVDDLCGRPDGSLPIPTPADLLQAAGDHQRLLSLLFGVSAPPAGDDLQLAVALRSHPLVAALLDATTGPNAGTTANRVAEHIATTYPSWGPVSGDDSDRNDRPSTEPVDTKPAAAVLCLIDLLGRAKVSVGANTVPMVEVLVEQTIRPVPRIMASVGEVSRYGAPGSVPIDNPRTITAPGPGRSGTPVSGAEGQQSADSVEPPERFLPAIACRNCGSTGWLAAVLGHERLIATMPTRIDLPFGHQGGNLAVIMVNDSGDDPTATQITRLDPGTLRLETRRLDRSAAGATRRTVDPGGNGAGRTAQQHRTAEQHADDFESGGSAVPVRYYTGASDVAQRLCPSCGRKGSVDFVGASADDLTTRITQYVGNTGSAAHTRAMPGRSASGTQKVLVVTGSVAAAEKQIEVLSAGSYGTHLRARLTALLANGPMDPQRLATALVDTATTADERYRLAPMDLRSDPSFASLATDTPDPADLAVLRDRLAYEIGLQIGIDSVAPTSLVGSDLGTAGIEVGSLDAVRDVIAANLETHGDDPVEPERIDRYMDGLLERLRLNGAIRNPLLETFILEGGNPAFITETRERGLPVVDQDHWPRFLTTAVTSSLDSVTAIHQHAGGARTWLVEWACSILGINASDAPAVNWATMDALAEHSDAVFAVDSLDGHRVYGLEPRALRLQVTSAGKVDGTGHVHTVGRANARSAEAAGSDLRAHATFGRPSDVVARTEWEFQYGTDHLAPNVLVIAPDQVSGSSQSNETTDPLAALSTSGVDVSVVDVVVVEQDRSAEVPHVMTAGPTGRVEASRSTPLSRVGASRGIGTVIDVGVGVPDGPTEVVPPARRDHEDRPGPTGESTPDEYPSAEQLGLPAVPSDGLQIDESDYLDFLLDRMGDGTLHFRYPLGSISSFMDLADTIPEDMVLAADRHDEETAGHDSQNTAAVDPQIQYQVPKGVNAPVFVADERTSALQRGRRGDDLIPEQFAPKRRGVFQSLVIGSNEKRIHIERFLEVVSNHVKGSRAAELRNFADSGVASLLETLRAAWHNSAGPSDSAGTFGARTVDPDTFWVDGLKALMNIAGIHDRMVIVDDLEVADAGVEAGDHHAPVPQNSPPPSGAPVSVDLHAPPAGAPVSKSVAGRVAVEQPDRRVVDRTELLAEVSFLLPVLDIQGFERAHSAAAALVRGMMAVFSQGDDTGSDKLPLSVTTRSRRHVEGAASQWYVTISPDPDGDRKWAKRILEALTDRDGLAPIIDAALESIADCRCDDPRAVPCVPCLRNDSTRVTLVSTDSSDDPNAVDFALDTHLAVEVLENMSQRLPVVVAGEPSDDTDPSRLHSRELARAFMTALAAWIDRDPDVEGVLELRPSSAAHSLTGRSRPASGIVYELSLTFADVRRRYHLTVPDWSLATPNGVPAVSIEPVGTSDWPVVALQLQADGAVSSGGESPVGESATPTLDGDRTATPPIRWILTWADLRGFYDAATNSEASDVTEHILLTRELRTWIRDHTGSAPDDRQEDRSVPSVPESVVKVEALEQNAFALLLDMLARPDRKGWSNAVGTIAAAVAAVIPSAVSDGSGVPTGSYRAPGGTDLTVDVTGGRLSLRLAGADGRTSRSAPAGSHDVDDKGRDDRHDVADQRFWRNVLGLQ